MATNGVITEMKNEVEVFWVVTLCSVAVRTLVSYCNTIWRHDPEEFDLGVCPVCSVRVEKSETSNCETIN